MLKNIHPTEYKIKMNRIHNTGLDKRIRIYYGIWLEIAKSGFLVFYAIFFNKFNLNNTM